MSLAFDKRGDWIEENPQMYLQGLFEESATKKHPLGTTRKLSDGREFIYVKVGGTATVAGQLYQARVPVIANEANLAVTANANIGDKELSITMGDSTLANTANALTDGYIWVSTGASNGHAYKIKSHAAIAANANGNIALYDKIRDANVAAATSKVSLVPHPCYAVIVKPATKATATMVGVAPMVITANYFGWLQKKGPCAVEVDGTVIAGDKVISRSAAGCVSPITANTEVDAEVGVCIANNANDHWALVDLRL